MDSCPIGMSDGEGGEMGELGSLSWIVAMIVVRLSWVVVTLGDFWTLVGWWISMWSGVEGFV